jgi:hypothetical protein
MIERLNPKDMDSAITLYDGFMPLIEILHTSTSTKVQFLLMLAISLAGRDANKKMQSDPNIECINNMISDINEYINSRPDKKHDCHVVSEDELFDAIKDLLKDK